MDAAHFDRMTRTLAGSVSRRTALRIAAVVATMAANQAASGVHAKATGKKNKARRRRRRNSNAQIPAVEPTPNAYGCLSVGQPCLGQNELCCSGLCEGPEPKKGKQDQRTCAARNTGDCVAAQDSCLVGQNVPCLSNGVCTQTTGQSTFCAWLGVGKCMECKHDADCFLLGPGAACIVCPVSCPQSTTACFAAAS